jgi:FkbM family methyltransferase
MRFYPKWYVHAGRIEEAEGAKRLFTFPDGFQCFSHSSREETELLYNEIFVRGDYRRFGASIREGGTVFDVGANIGLFTLQLCRSLSGVRVFCFEPMAETFEVLNANIRLHGLSAVRTFNCALGSANGRKAFTYFPNTAGNSTSRPRVRYWQRTLLTLLFGKRTVDQWYTYVPVVAEVRTVSSMLDELKLPSLDFLKVDVEGDELEVLQGIRTEHAGSIGRIAVEVHGSWGMRRKVIGMLREAGFSTQCLGNISFLAGNTDVYAFRPDA